MEPLFQPGEEITIPVLGQGLVRIAERIAAYKDEAETSRKEQNKRLTAIDSPKNGALKQMRDSTDDRLSRQNKWIAGLFISFLLVVIAALATGVF